MKKAIQTIIAQTGFCTSIFTYALLLISNAIRPGFVARYFSPHIFLLAAIVFGIWWAANVKEYKEKRFLNWLISLSLAILLSVITWNFGEGFREYRIIMVIIAFVTPFVVQKILKPLTSNL